MFIKTIRKQIRNTRVGVIDLKVYSYFGSIASKSLMTILVFLACLLTLLYP